MINHFWAEAPFALWRERMEQSPRSKKIKGPPPREPLGEESLDRPSKNDPVQAAEGLESGPKDSAVPRDVPPTCRACCVMMKNPHSSNRLPTGYGIRSGERETSETGTSDQSSASAGLADASTPQRSQCVVFLQRGAVEGAVDIFILLVILVVL